MASYRDEPISLAELERISLFQGIEPSSLIGLLVDCPVLCLERDELLIAQGAANRSCYFILSGSLLIQLDSLDGLVLSTLNIGESVGEFSLLDGQLASANVVCPDRCQVLVLKEEVFWSLVNSFHVFCRHLLFLMISRLRSSNMSISASFKKQREFQLDATIDALTGLHNRRWLMEMLERQMKRSLGEGTPLALLVIDADHFKQVNDVYGHGVGDQVLQGLARTMLGGVRPQDLLARYGGEEFVVILPESRLAEAVGVAERLRLMIVEARIAASVAEPPPLVTVSIGVAEMLKSDTEAELFSRADAALYLAKQNGRNRVEG